MPTLVNKATGVKLTVSDATAKNLGPEWSAERKSPRKSSKSD